MFSNFTFSFKHRVKYSDELKTNKNMKSFSDMSSMRLPQSK